MIAILSAKKVVRAGKKVGKIVVKPVNFFYVEALEGSDKYGLNVHACGKVEFFRNAQYTAPDGSGAVVYKEMLRVAQAAA